MIEYAFLIALIAIVVVGAALFLGTGLNDKFSEVGDTLQAS
jgi:Flp pilus assembly pilin Flp